MRVLRRLPRVCRKLGAKRRSLSSQQKTLDPRVQSKLCVGVFARRRNVLSWAEVVAFWRGCIY